MVSFLESLIYRLLKLAQHYEMFGWRGVVFVIKAKFLTEPTEVVVTAPGIETPFTLRLKTTDIDTYRQVFIKNDYDYEGIVSPKFILDAGANVGLASIYFAHKFPEARIVAIEPEETNFSLLKKNTSPYSTITPLQVALWNVSEEVQLIDPGKGKWGFRTVSSNPNSNTSRLCYAVRGMTVDEIMLEQGVDYIDILKIDIEGAEKEVFADAAKWIDKVGLLIIELHERYKQGCNRNFYNATNNFDMEWRQGENIYLAKNANTE